MKQNRTKTAIAEAFLRLLNDYTIDKITVKMITDVVGCSRKTFYYYFTDIYDLTQYVCQQRMQALVGDHANFDTVRKGFLALAEYLSSDRQIILNMYHGYGKEELERFSWQTNYHYVRDVITRCVQGRNIAPEDLDAVIHMYTDMLFGMLVDWVNNNMDTDYMRTLDIALSGLPHVLDGLSKPQIE